MKKTLVFAHVSKQLEMAKVKYLLEKRRIKFYMFREMSTDMYGELGDYIFVVETTSVNVLKKLELIRSGLFNHRTDRGKVISITKLIDKYGV